MSVATYCLLLAAMRNDFMISIGAVCGNIRVVDRRNLFNDVISLYLEGDILNE